MSDFSVLKYSVNILGECLRILMTAASSPKPIITCCSVLSPEIFMHNAYIGGRSENDIKCVVHDDLGWKN